MHLKTLLLDPKTVLAGVIGGFVVGLFAKPLGEALLPIGTLYVSFLSMCLLPILITAVVTGIAGLLRDPSTRVLFKTMAIYYVAGLILPCVVGIVTALLLPCLRANRGQCAFQMSGAVEIDDAQRDRRSPVH